MFENLRWLPLVIPFGIQLPLLIVQIVFARRSMKLSEKQLEEAPRWLTENARLWRINRLLVEWVKINHPDSYEDFNTVCLSEEDVKLLQLKECEGDFDESGD